MTNFEILQAAGSIIMWAPSFPIIIASATAWIFIKIEKILGHGKFTTT